MSQSTDINIDLTSKKAPELNLTVAESPSIDQEIGSGHLIEFIATGAQGVKGDQGIEGNSFIDDGSVTQSNLSSDSVGSDEIINNSVGYDELAVSSVRGNRIMPLSITTTHLNNESVTQGKLADNSVGADQIINGTVTAELISDSSILGDKLGDLSITAGKIADLAITTIKLRDRNVTGAKIASNADLDGEVKANNLKLKGSSPATLTGPDSYALQLKTNTTLDVLNTSGETKVSIDQSGNLTLSGTVDGRDVAIDGAKLDTISANDAIDWTVDQGSTNIHSGNYTDTDTVYTHPDHHAISVITGLQTALDNKVDDSQVLTNVPVNAIFTDTDTVYTHPTSHPISLITGLQTALNAKQDSIGDEDLTIAMTDGLQDALNAKVDDSQVLTDVPANAVFTDTNTQLPLIDSDTMTGASATNVASAESIKAYVDGAVIPNTDTQLTQEQVEDYAGNLIESGTKTGITVTYDDGNGVINMVVDHDAANNFVTEEHYRWDNDISGTATINAANIPTLNQDTTGSSHSTVITVKNDTGTAMGKGTAVHITGEDISSNTTVIRADYDNANAMPAAGVTNESIDAGAIGEIIVLGEIAGVNTSSFSEGDEVWVGANGSYVTTKPTGEGFFIQKLAVITHVDSSNGAAIIIGAGRSNDVPNLNSGHIFYGNGSNQAVSTQLSTLLPAAYTDAEAVSAVATADDYLKNDASDTIAGNLTVDADFIYLKDQSGSLAAARFTTDTLTANRTVTIPDATGVIALTNSQKHFINFGINLAYAYSRYIPIGSYYILEQNTDANPEYTTYVAPYDGKFIKALVRSEESLANTTLTIYKVGDGTEEPDQGSTVDTKTVDIASANTSYTYTFDADATFSKGDAISIKIQPTTDPVGAGVTGTFVLEFDLTT